MDLQYELTAYSDEVERAYIALLPEQARELAHGKLRWKFAKNPAGIGMIALARAGREVVGLNAFQAATFRHDGHTALGFQSMDTIVAPQVRGKGVFSKLINSFYTGTPGELLYGFPNANSAPGFFGKLGWTELGQVPMLFRPLRTGYFCRRLASFLPDLPLPSFAKGCHEAVPITRFDQRAERQWERFAVGINCAVERSADFLNWRLIDHPSEKYDVVGTPDGAFAAWTVAEKHGGRVGYVMEAIGEERLAARLIATAIAKMAAARADVALAWCLPHSPNYRAYRRAGFYPLPPVLRPIHIFFGGRSTGADWPAVADPKSWYLSYLDSDTI